MADKKFSELSTASEIKNSDFMALSQDTGNGMVSLKATILAIATKILTAINFTSALTTTEKTIIGAINEVAEGGGGGGTDVIAEDFDSTSTYAVGDYCIYNGSLYKCTTAVTTAGDWDSSDWTETLVMDEVEQGGGGGGAGHTIKDDSGNALTQRSNLQFKGVYSHDDSTNSASVVEVAREMTWAEYQLLSAAEKKGLITITDRYTADAMFVNGVFVDMDNVIKSQTNVPSSDIATWSYTATQDCVIYISIQNNAGQSATIRIDGKNIAMASASYAYRTTAFTLLKKGQVVTVGGNVSSGVNTQYAVYGIQTGTNPSIPDYSTTEHKIGRKWIDGKDIWEKTYSQSTTIGLTANAWTDITNFDVSGIDKIIDFEVIRTVGATAGYGYVQVAIGGTPSKLQVFNNRNLLVEIDTITLRYTKSS